MDLTETPPYCTEQTYISFPFGSLDLNYPIYKFHLIEQSSWHLAQYDYTWERCSIYPQLLNEDSSKISIISVLEQKEPDTEIQSDQVID